MAMSMLHALKNPSPQTHRRWGWMFPWEQLLFLRLQFSHPPPPQKDSCTRAAKGDLPPRDTWGNPCTWHPALCHSLALPEPRGLAERAGTGGSLSSSALPTTRVLS